MVCTNDDITSQVDVAGYVRRDRPPRERGGSQEPFPMSKTTAAKFDLYGGDPSLDFVNTVDGMRGFTAVEQLGSYPRLLDWAVQASLVGGGGGARARAACRGAADPRRGGPGRGLLPARGAARRPGRAAGRKAGAA